MMRLVTLGTSASLPSPKHFPNCFALKSQNTFLLDCCEAAQKQMMTYAISYGKLRAVFLSHLHADHFLGVFGLVQTLNLAGRTEPLLVTGPRGVKALLGEVFGHRELQPNFPLEINELGEESAYRDKFVEVRAFKVRHGTPALGYVIQQPPQRKFDEAKAKGLGIKGRLFTEIQQKGSLQLAGKTVRLDDVSTLQARNKIAYSGDTVACEEVARAATDADLLIHDSSFLEAHKEMAAEKNHSTAADAARTAAKAKAKRLLLTHFSNRYDDRKPFLTEAKSIFPNSLLAEEGQEILFK